MDDELLLHVKTPKELADLASSYLSRQVMLHTNLDLTSCELDRLFKLIHMVSEENSQCLYNFIVDYHANVRTAPGDMAQGNHGPVIRLLAELLKIYMEPIGNVVLCLHVLQAFISVEENIKFVVEYHVTGVVLGSVAAHAHVRDIQLYGCRILAELAKYLPEQSRNSKALVREAAVDIVLQTVKNFPDDLELIGWSVVTMATVARTLKTVVRDTVQYDDASRELHAAALEFIRENCTPVVLELQLKFVSCDIVQRECRRFLDVFKTENLENGSEDAPLDDEPGSECSGAVEEDQSETIDSVDAAVVAVDSDNTMAEFLSSESTNLASTPVDSATDPAHGSVDKHSDLPPDEPSMLGEDSAPVASEKLADDNASRVTHSIDSTDVEVNDAKVEANEDVDETAAQEDALSESDVVEHETVPPSLDMSIDLPTGISPSQSADQSIAIDTMDVREQSTDELNQCEDAVPVSACNTEQQVQEQSDKAELSSISCEDDIVVSINEIDEVVEKAKVNPGTDLLADENNPEEIETTLAPDEAVNNAKEIVPITCTEEATKSAEEAAKSTEEAAKFNEEATKSTEEATKFTEGAEDQQISFESAMIGRDRMEGSGLKISVTKLSQSSEVVDRTTTDQELENKSDQSVETMLNAAFAGENSDQANSGDLSCTTSDSVVIDHATDPETTHNHAHSGIEKDAVTETVHCELDVVVDNVQTVSDDVQETEDEVQEKEGVADLNRSLLTPETEKSKLQPEQSSSQDSSTTSLSIDRERLQVRRSTYCIPKPSCEAVPKINGSSSNTSDLLSPASDNSAPDLCPCEAYGANIIAADVLRESHDLEILSDIDSDSLDRSLQTPDDVSDLPSYNECNSVDEDSYSLSDCCSEDHHSPHEFSAMPCRSVSCPGLDSYYKSFDDECPTDENYSEEDDDFIDGEFAPKVRSERRAWGSIHPPDVEGLLANRTPSMIADTMEDVHKVRRRHLPPSQSDPNICLSLERKSWDAMPLQELLYLEEKSLESRSVSEVSSGASQSSEPDEEGILDYLLSQPHGYMVQLLVCRTQVMLYVLSYWNRKRYLTVFDILGRPVVRVLEDVRLPAEIADFARSRQSETVHTTFVNILNQLSKVSHCMKSKMVQKLLLAVEKLLVQPIPTALSIKVCDSATVVLTRWKQPDRKSIQSMISTVSKLQAKDETEDEIRVKLNQLLATVEQYCEK